MTSIFKRIVKITSVMLLVYFIIMAGFFVFQEELIFQSEGLTKEFVFRFDQQFDEYFIPTPDGQLLNALLFKTSIPAKGLILYFHGNADNLARWGKYAEDFTRHGYDILMMDYRGYGKSSGETTEDALYMDALTVWNWAESNLPHDNIIIYGRSLGAALASSLAVRTNPDLLILETPFDELKGVVYPLFITNFYLFPLRYHFPNNIFLAEVKCKKVIIQGTDDWVVPLSSASRLKPLLKKDDLFIVIPGGSHNNLREFEMYHHSLAEILN